MEILVTVGTAHATTIKLRIPSFEKGELGGILKGGPPAPLC